MFTKKVGFKMITLFNILCFLTYFNTGMVVYLTWKYQKLWNHYMKFAQESMRDVDGMKNNVIRILHTLEKLKKDKDGK